MVDKLWNTLKYGSGKTKKKIYLMLGILAAGVILTIASLIFANIILGSAAFMIILIDGLILFNSSFEQKTVAVSKNPMEKASKEKKEKKEKQKAATEEEGPGALEWISSEKKEKEDEEYKDKEDQEESVEETNPLAKYSEKSIKKLFVAYKVKKHHVSVLIDLCAAEKIIQRPAYMWKDAAYVYFLVLDEEPRLLKSELSKWNGIQIRRGVSARPTEEYSELDTKSVVGMIFGGLVPKYYTAESSSYRTEYRKNMYSAAPGIWCTSGSVKNMLKILSPRFVLEDGRFDSESIYYQEIYIVRIMFYDGIYSAQEYKEKVLEVLDELIRAEISDSTVKEYLNSMLMKGLIPREYAEYVISKRKKK